MNTEPIRAAIVWLLQQVNSAKDFLSDPINMVSMAVLVLVALYVAFPAVRRDFHDTLDATHRVVARSKPACYFCRRAIWATPAKLLVVTHDCNDATMPAEMSLLAHSQCANDVAWERLRPMNRAAKANARPAQVQVDANRVDQAWKDAHYPDEPYVERAGDEVVLRNYDPTEERRHEHTEDCDGECE